MRPGQRHVLRIQVRGEPERGDQSGQRDVVRVGPGLPGDVADSSPSSDRVTGVVGQAGGGAEEAGPAARDGAEDAGGDQVTAYPARRGKAALRRPQPQRIRAGVTALR